MNFPGANGSSTITDPNLTSPITTCQEIRYENFPLILLVNLVSSFI